MDPTRVALPLSVFEGQNPNVDPAQVPLPPSFAETSAKNPADNSHPSVASLYLKYAQETDETALSLWHSDLDVLLIFAALFSAVVTSFVVQSFGDLQEDFNETSSQLLKVLVLQSAGQEPNVTLPAPFKAQRSTVIASAFFVASLVISLGTALLLILCKQWLRQYKARLSPIPSIRARQRHSRWQALENWRVSDFIAILPVTLHIAVILFFVGLVEYLRLINEAVMIVALTTVAVASGLYFILFALPFVSDAPFHTPMTILLFWGIFYAICYTIFLPVLIFLGFFIVALRLILREPIRFRELWTSGIGLWTSITRWLHTAKLDYAYDIVREVRSDSEREESDTELLAWLIRCPLQNSDLQQVVKAFSGVKQLGFLETLEKAGADIMLLHQMESSCFTHDRDGTLKLLPDRIPLAISCISSWLEIVTLGAGIRLVYRPFLISPAAHIVNVLLNATTGIDKIKVLAASAWWTDEDKQVEERRLLVHQYLLEHLEGVQELPDDVIRILIDTPQQQSETSPIIVKLLQRYLQQESLPSMDCISAILLNLCNTHALFPMGHRSSPANMLASLMYEEHAEKPPLLHLIRALWKSDPATVKDRNLAIALLYLLSRSANLQESFVVDLLQTISYAPDSCKLQDRALLNLVQCCQRHPTGPIFQAAVKAIAAFLESIFHSGQYPASDRTLEKQIREVTNTLMPVVSKSQPEEAVFPALYALSIISRHSKRCWDLSLPALTTLIPILSDCLAAPTSARQIAITQHVLRVIYSIILHDLSKAAPLLDSISIWEKLISCEDVWIRWMSLEILKHMACLLPREERRQIYRIVRDEIQNRLQSTDTAPFIDHFGLCAFDFQRLTVSQSTAPDPALIKKIEEDIAGSGIRALLEAAPATAICETSIFSTTDFPWLYHFDTWLAENPAAI